MAITTSERKLLVNGEWIETGDWLEVRSPYSGDVVGRVVKGGTEETRRAIDAAEQAMRDPLPAHKRAEILVRVAGAMTVVVLGSFMVLMFRRDRRMAIPVPPAKTADR